jgi:hypothetical protein
VGDSLDVYELRPDEVVSEFLALSVVESTYSPGLRVTVVIDRAHALISDSGRGMQLRPDAGDSLAHAERALTTAYPVYPESSEIRELLSQLVWGARGSFGPALANRHCLQLQYWSFRDGQVWTQQFRAGKAMSIPQRVGASQAVGTKIALTTQDDIDVRRVAALVDQLVLRVPSIEISFQSSPV